MQICKFHKIISVLILFILVSCSGEYSISVPEETLEGDIVPYITVTSTTSVSVTENEEVNTATPIPIPTPTPRIHIVEGGEDLGGIAFLYGITVSKILEYNPEIDPYMMSIGTELIIPHADEDIGDNPVIPTPIITNIGDLDCYEDSNFGFWCFCELYNDQEFDIEGISAAFVLKDDLGDEISKKNVSTPLKRVQAQSSMPLIVYYPLSYSNQYMVDVNIISSLRIEDNSQRYSNRIEIVESNIEIEETGITATINGKVEIVESQNQDNKVWLLAVAYNESNKVIGTRLWSSNNELQEGDTIDFSLNVFSVDSSIDHVDLLSDIYP